VLSWNVVDHGARCLPCSQRLLDYLAFQLFDFELPDKELYLKRFGCDARWFLLDALRQNSLTRMYVVLLHIDLKLIVIMCVLLIMTRSKRLTLKTSEDTHL
jgi:hypothetical protein